MKLREVLELPSMAGTELVAGTDGLDRDVLWSHVVDMPDPVPWVRPGFMLLISGYSWPHGAEGQRAQIAGLAGAGVAAIGMAVPRYVEHFTQAARDEANRSGIPLIEIPWEIPFARIMEELHRAVMAEPYRIIERSEQIHGALTRVAARNASLDEIAQSLSALIGHSVSFEDAGGKLLAECAIDETPNDRSMRRIRCPIRIGAEIAGTVWILEGDSPLSELDRRAAEHAALVAAIHIAHQRELAYVEARLGYASFLSLLESEPGDKPVAEERVRLLGFDPGGRYRVGIVLVPEELPLEREAVLRRDRIAARVRDALKHMGVEQLVTVNLNHVPFLLPEGKSVDPIRAALGDPSLKIIFGRVQGGADGARTSYREALSLLSYRHREPVCYFEDLLVPRVIMGDANARETFLADLFAPLRSRKSGAQLAQALLALARGGFHFRETAAALGIHPNTLRYRLDRATQLLGIELDDADVRFRLQLASRLLDLENRPW